ncbi:MAG: 2-oxoglutarate dehydrogenase E1 component, partial [Pseudomonadota bacterium]
MAHDGAQGEVFALRDMLQATSFLSGGNRYYLNQQYKKYTENPQSVEPELRSFFDDLDDIEVAAMNATGPSWARADWPPRPSDETTAALGGDWTGVEGAFEKKIVARSPSVSATDVASAVRDSIRALMLIRAYRIRGHLIADLDPLKIETPDVHPELTPEHYGFKEEDLDREIFIDHVLGLETASINTIMTVLQRTYCGTFAVEFIHITDPAQKDWMQRRIEGMDKEIKFTEDGNRAILLKLIEAEGFENFL